MKRVFYLLTLSLFLFSCKKENNSSDNGYWTVKYEVTSATPGAGMWARYVTESGDIAWVGDYVYNNPGALQSLPWTYEAKWSKDPGLVSARDIGVNIEAYGPSSSTVITEKIYVDGKLVTQSSTGTVKYTLH